MNAPMPTMAREFNETELARFWAKVDLFGPGGCWLWMAALSTGYGHFKARGRMMKPHRISYELLIGPVPEHLELDHLCRVRRCLNPGHLEPVTMVENIRRGQAPNVVASQTGRCKRDHPLVYRSGIRKGVLTKWRECPECKSQWERAYRASGRRKSR